jgi:hypothetical protein
MLLTEMSFDDLILLEQFRIERLRSFFSQSLMECSISIHEHDLLTINCPEPWLIDTLIDDIEELCEYAWLILGVESIVLSFAQEEVYRVDYHRIPRAIRNFVQSSRLLFRGAGGWFDRL